MYKRKKKPLQTACTVLCLLFFMSSVVPAYGAGQAKTPDKTKVQGQAKAPGKTKVQGQAKAPDQTEGQAQADALTRDYEVYHGRLDGICREEDIAAGGFQVIENQVFPLTLKAHGEVYLIPALDTLYDRLAIFFADLAGRIVYRTDQLAANNRNPGALKQPAKGLAAVSFQDMNGDGMTDVVLITTSEKSDGTTYKVGDVLFQNDKGFYQDYRLSDQINRFGMNKSIRFVTSFIKEGYSTEFLYTSLTLKELLDHGFQIAEKQSYWKTFEKLGRLRVVPGTYHMAEYTVFMIYLINEQGNIAWSFQPMGDHESLYALKGVTCQDIDGDGLKDLMVLARYSSSGEGDDQVISSDYAIYYQRTGGFYEDTEIKEQLVCAEDETLAGLADQAREYWGWHSNDSNSNSG